MGCISSKHVVAGACSPSPAVLDIVEAPPSTKGGHSSLVQKTCLEDERNNKFEKNGSKKSNGSSFSFRVGLAHRYVEAEQNAAGWPPWLTGTAAEAIQGWIPLKADSFQKLEKVIILFEQNLSSCLN